MPDSSRVLLAVLVYNGRDFVPSCLESAARLTSRSDVDVDVLVLDDCSPEPGWSEELAALSLRLDLQYYRSPRNLGIPRNMNLGLLRGLDAGYDYVLLCNSDVVLPANLLTAMTEAAESSSDIASVTAWSNSVSIFSLPNQDPDTNVCHQGAVDFLSAALHGEFRKETLDIPTAVGFCMLIPTAAVRDNGLLDPVFGRGYCEEVDWCLRGLPLGYRHVLAPSTFVYHVGSATSRIEGILERGQSTSWANERIIDMRHPGYRAQLAAFNETSNLSELMQRGLRAIILNAAREWGYSIEASWLHRTNPDRQVQFVVEPDGRRPLLTGRFQGFDVGFDLDGSDVLRTVEQIVGSPPAGITVFDRGHLSEILVSRGSEKSIVVDIVASYPERV